MKVAVALIITLAACTLENMTRMSGNATTAKQPKSVHFPEGERNLASNARAWVKQNTAGKLLHAYILEGHWQKTRNGDSVSVLIYTEEPAKGVVKPAEGEHAVCYEYPCEMYKEVRSSTHITCNTPMLVKVTCKSAHALR